jgi:tellurite resistance protein
MNERLKNFPVSFFAVVMGLAGAAIAWQPMESDFIKQIEMTGALDNFSRVLYHFVFFVFILMIPQLKMLARIKYYLSWWAYTFPLAALTIATIVMYHHKSLGFFKYLAVIMLFILSCVVIMLAVMTLVAVINRKICVED